MGTKREEINPLTVADALLILSENQISVADGGRVLNALSAAGIVVCKPSEGCLGKAAWDEPLFILRAHDMIAPFIVRQWARMYYMLNTTARNIASSFKPELRLSVQPEIQKKHDEAMRCADAMEAWHDRKIPD